MAPQGNFHPKVRNSAELEKHLETADLSQGTLTVKKNKKLVCSADYVYVSKVAFKPDKVTPVTGGMGQKSSKLGLWRKCLAYLIFFIKITVLHNAIYPIYTIPLD